MGYDVHITRRENWFDFSGPAISRSEWFHLVSRDPSLTLAREVIVENKDGEKISLQEPTLTLWREWSVRKEGQTEALLWLSDGNIWAKDPDQEFRRKMFLIAGVLQAQVQGRDGEYYTASGAVVASRTKRWWTFW